MLCRQRQSSLMMLRNMLRPPVPLYVYRNNMWNIQSSELLVPGDVVSLVSVNKHSKGEFCYMSFIA